MVTNVRKLNGMIGMNCKGDSHYVGGRERRLRKHKIIVTAGVPRSGSTWLFNAARFCLEKSSAIVHAVWCEDYEDDMYLEVDFHVVKIHRPDQLTFEYDYMLTTRRDEVEQLASLIRMGWLTHDAAQIQKKSEYFKALFAYWQKYSDLLIDYSDIITKPTVAIYQIGHLFDIHLTSEDMRKISNDLDALQAPTGKSYDRKTLLHPQHRAQAEEREHYIRLVKDALTCD